jgi:hypothetical protein
MYKLIIYVPKDNAEAVKSAIFQTGAGCLGNYESCSWETEGVGQFKPLVGAKPTLGSVGSIERVPELRVEILCVESNIKAAIDALKANHIYEEPAFEVISIENHALIQN